MSGHQTATLEDSVYFWFAANDTSGSGGDGASALYDVREAGAVASAIPLLSGSPALLSHANYPAGCYEIVVAATAANGFAANDTFAVFCTLAVDSQNPTGFVGSCTLTPLAKASGVLLANGAITNASLAGNMEIVFETDFGTNYNTTRDAWATNYTDYIGVIPAAALGADCITEAKIADNALANEHFASGALTSTEVTSVASVDNLAVGSGGISTIANSNTLVTTGTETLTYTATPALDSSYHEVAVATTIEFYYQFDVGASGIPISCEWIGYVNTINDNVEVYFYDWTNTQWQQVGTIEGTVGATDQTETFIATTDHVGVGANVGIVRLRFESSGGDVATVVATDRVLCTYTQAASGIANGSTVTLGAATVNTNLMGHNWTLDLSGEDISGSYIFQSTNIFGTGTGTNGNPFTIQECQIATATLDAFCFIEKCAFSAAVTWASTGGVSSDTVDILNSFSNVAGSGSPTHTWAGVTKTTNINVRKWYGGGIWIFTSNCTASIEVAGGGTHTITTGGGDIELRGAPKAVVVATSGSGTTNVIVWSSCPVTITGNGGTVNVYGNYDAVTVSGALAGSTVNLYGLHGAVSADGGGTINDNGQDLKEIATILADTNELQSDDVPGLIAALNDPTAAAVATAVWATQVESEGTYTAQQVMSILLAACAGITSNGGATLETPNGNANRITATTNASNERTAMTLNPSS